ncbi:NACHT domain-containing protein [Spirosoma areae]
MTREQKIDSIKDIDKEVQIHEILIDLLEGMGYADVTLTHERGNLPENGKDIVASRIDSIENKKEWTAFVIKKGDIRGTSQGVQEIVAQVNDCFTYTWNSLTHGRNIRISKVKVVTNGKFNSGAEQKILENNSLNSPNIGFWSNTELVKYIDDYCGRIWLKGNRDYKKYIEIFQKKNKDDDITKAIGLDDKKIKRIINFSIQPKLIDVSINDSGELKKKWFDLHSVANYSGNSLIVGEAGSGKSTFFKLLAGDIIEQNFIRDNYELYPIIITFSDLKAEGYDINKSIHNYFLSSDYKDILIDSNSILSNQKFILFIDALDELGNGQDKSKALIAVYDFKKEYPDVRIYCSSRPADSLLEDCQKINFKYLEISNVTMQQAEQFMNRYFNEDEIKCQRLLKSLRDTNLLDKMPKTPLTLALVAAIFDENHYEIPATISDLYKYFVDTLLNKQFKNSTLEIMNIGVHRSVLSFLAEHLHVNRIKTIGREKLIEIVTDFAKDRGHKYNVDELISEFVNSLGLLVENDRKEIQFKHLSFQEYLTAYQFYNHSINGKDKFIENFNDLWWQNVAIFYAGMTKDSPELIDEILAKSVPTNFKEYLVNLGGMGHLMQALYNTPISALTKGIISNLNNANKAVAAIKSSDRTEFELIKRMWNTEFGLLKVVSNWFEFHHNSITLRASLEKVFNEMIDFIKNPLTNLVDRRTYEYYAYILAVTLYALGDEDFQFLSKIYVEVDKKNFHVLALIDAGFREEYDKLSRDRKNRKAVKRLKDNLELLSKNKSIIVDNVNIRLIDGTFMKTFSKRPRSNMTKSRKNNRNKN